MMDRPNDLEALLHAWKAGGASDLAEGMRLVATYQYPDLTHEKLQAKLAALYREATAAYKPVDDPQEKVNNLNGVFFGQLGFGANTKSFHAPENSFLNVVLDTKQGMPITLCVLYLLTGNHLGLPLYGVNLPNLFILTYKTPETQFYINVFNKGVIFSRADIDNYIGQLNLPPSDVFYQPCTPLDIVARVLRNLVLAYDQLGEAPKRNHMEVLLAALEA
jgi:regulator of sirC expression with transglutaminase-like and TPR domain